MTALLALLALVQSEELLVAIEDGGAVLLDTTTGKKIREYKTGPNAFGALFAPDGRSFITDKTEGTLVDLRSLESVKVGDGPQQPAVTREGRMYIPLSGGEGIAVIQDGKVVRRIHTGPGTKPHIVSLSPDEKTLWATVQGRDPKVVSITLEGEVVKDHRYDLVPRVICATDQGAWFTAHHSTGLHFVSLEGRFSTPYVDQNGPHSEPRKQIEGVAVSGSTIALTHEGRRALVILDGDARKVREFALASQPYWVSLRRDAAFVSIPGAGLVEAYSLRDGSLLWSSKVGGKPKRMALR